MNGYVREFEMGQLQRETIIISEDAIGASSWRQNDG